MKTCAHKECQQVNPQPSTAFYANKKNADGLYSYCKKCFMKHYTTPRNTAQYKAKYAAKAKASKIQLYNLPGEVWKDVPGFDGRYEISNMARVKSIYRGFYKIRATPINKVTGYRYLTFSVDAKTTTAYVHRLVAEAFIPNPNNYPEINHKDGNRANNDLNNIEWCTHQQNIHHAIHVLKKHATIQSHNNAVARAALPTKECKVCKVPKDRTEFHVNNRYYDGFSHICKVCANTKRKKEKNVDKDAQDSNSSGNNPSQA